MENILIIINARDIEPALKISANLNDYKVITHDPHLIDNIKIKGFKNIVFFNWENCDNYSEIANWGNQASVDAETGLDATAQHFFPGLSIRSWQAMAMAHMLIMLKWFEGLWRDFPKVISSKYHIFIYDNPFTLSGWSFLPAIMLLENLASKGMQFSAYSYGTGDKPVDVNLIPNLVGTYESSESASLLTHLPTCFYDYPYINAELSASGRRVINLESDFFNIPVLNSISIKMANIDALIDTLNCDVKDRIEKFTEAMFVDLKNLIGKYIKTPTYYERQATRMARVYRAQVVLYFLLQQYFRTNKPGKMLLSDHDGGIHGPLIAFAKENDIPVLMFPHSKQTRTIAFQYDNITCLTHPIQGSSIANGNGRQLLNFHLNFPETFSGSSVFPERIKNICLVLNELCCYDWGVYYTRITPYLKGISRISEWCKKNGVALRIRCKPLTSMLTLLSPVSGIEINDLHADMSISMADFCNGQDLCLLYDIPTSGVIEFLKTSTPILNPVPGIVLTTGCFSFIPRESVEDILSRLDMFMADHTSFLRFRNEQFGNYVGAFKHSYPLRAFL